MSYVWVPGFILDMKKNQFPKCKINEIKSEMTYLTEPQGFQLTLNAVWHNSAILIPMWWTHR